MSETSEFVVRAVLIGVVATAILDVWGQVSRRVLRLPGANIAFLGRWAGHIPQGRFVHSSIAAAAPVRGELAIGWVVHFLVGVAFAAILLAIVGLDWARRPTLLPALLVGVATVAAPFFVMQPAMGVGVMAAKAPDPATARLSSLLGHTVFGFGLYLAALVSARLIP